MDRVLQIMGFVVSIAIIVLSVLFFLGIYHSNFVIYGGAALGCISVTRMELEKRKKKNLEKGS